jgi:adenylate kinase
MKIILLGPPGSGKGTQAIRISKKYKIAHISTGEILRRTVSQKNKLARAIKAYMNSGELVPDDIIVSIVTKRLKEKDAKKGFLLDGFPRNINQAKVLEKMLGNIDDFMVFYLRVSDGMVVRRLSKRRVCRKCGLNYHLEFGPPKIKGKCDKCGSDIYQRDDDRPVAIKNRLKVYKRESRPLIKYYEKKGILTSIDAEKSEDQVFFSFMKKIGK